MGPAVCQNFFNRVAFFEQRPDKVGEAFVIPVIFRGIPDNEGSRFSRTKIFQNLSTTRKIARSRLPAPLRLKGLRKRRKPFSSPTSASVRVPLGSGSVLTFILRELVTRGYAHSNPWDARRWSPWKQERFLDPIVRILGPFSRNTWPTWHARTMHTPAHEMRPHFCLAYPLPLSLPLRWLSFFPTFSTRTMNLYPSKSFSPISTSLKRLAKLNAINT